MSAMQLVSVDLGGTHARFALAEVAEGRVVSLGEPVTLKTAEYASLQTAWEAFGQQVGTPLPRAAAIGVASPVGGELIKLTNNPWIIRPALIPERLGVDTLCSSTISARSAMPWLKSGRSISRMCAGRTKRYPITDRSPCAAPAPGWAWRKCCG